MNRSRTQQKESVLGTMTESDMARRGFLDDRWQSTVVLYAKKPSLRGAKRVRRFLLCSGRVASGRLAGAVWRSLAELALPAAPRPNATCRWVRARAGKRLDDPVSTQTPCVLPLNV